MRRCAALQQQVGQLEEALRIRSESTSQLLAAKEAEVQLLQVGRAILIMTNV